MLRDEELLMAVLNSAPVADGMPVDELDSPSGSELIESFGGTGTTAELLHLTRARDALQATIRGDSDAVERVTAAIGGAALLPEVGDDGLRWQLDVPADERLGARAVLAWSRALTELPGRLRACANTDCNLYLIDHSRPGTAKWCSMATCGNRMKARTHARRSRRP